MDKFDDFEESNDDEVIDVIDNINIRKEEEEWNKK